nr:MAG TPA: hypothetical protein [Caudoviricetes sp.]
MIMSLNKTFIYLRFKACLKISPYDCMQKNKNAV